MYLQLEILIMMKESSVWDGVCKTPGIVFELLMAPIRMAVLETAIQMEMADILDSPMDPDAVIAALGGKGDRANVIYFLDALVAMGFAEKKEGVYVNSAFGSLYLKKDSPTYLGGLVLHLSWMQHRNLSRIPELLLHGPPAVAASDRLAGEEKWKNSVGHIACYQKAGFAGDVAGLLAELPEFSRMRRMLDLGCGPGIVCQAVVRRHPEMHGVLCDLAPVLEVAEEEIKAAGLRDRMSTIAGDYNTVAIGTGYDLIWASHTLYYAKDKDAVFSRIYGALAPGGVFVCLHEGLTEERTRPSGVVISRLSLALEGQDVSFARGEIASRLPAAGFSRVETRSVTMPMGPMELVIARKKGRENDG